MSSLEYAVIRRRRYARMWEAHAGVQENKNFIELSYNGWMNPSTVTSLKIKLYEPKSLARLELR